MSHSSPTFRPDFEHLESREVPSITMFGADNTPGTVDLSAEAQSATVNSVGTERFVTHLYQDVLGRQPDSSGLAFWVTSLDLGTFTQSDVSTRFMTSTEYRMNVINNFYVGILGRSPDASEMNNYLSMFVAGKSQDDIRGLFFASEEFFNRLGHNTTAFVTQLYSQILNRGATSGEVNFWVNVLNTTNGDRTSVAQGFLHSTEYEQLEVEAAYAVFLRRSPDQTGFNFWVGQRNSGQTIETVAVGFLASSEYFQRL